MGDTIKITINDEYKEKCSKDILWVDYKNIIKVLDVGKRMFIDDGLISVIVKEKGELIRIDGHVYNLTKMFCDGTYFMYAHENCRRKFCLFSLKNFLGRFYVRAIRSRKLCIDLRPSMPPSVDKNFNLILRLWHA